MLLHTYLARQCATHGIRRGQIPELLQLSNVNKALRRFDALVAGGLHDEDLIDRIRRCEPLGGDAFEEALAETRHQIAVDEQERALHEELQRRAAFRPHLWVIHENRVPSPIFVVAMLGIDRFKRIELPDEIAALTHTGHIMMEIASMLNERLKDPKYLSSPFGKPKQILYRDAYDHSYVYDVAERRFTDEQHKHPPIDRVSMGRKRNLGSQFPFRIR